MEDWITTAGIIGGSIIGGYTALLFGAQAVQDFASQKITSQKELDQIVEEESARIGLDPESVLADLHLKGTPKYKQILGARCSTPIVDVDGTPVQLGYIELKEGYGARKGTVRHELYHIKHHLSREKRGFLRKFLWEEPTATLYALTGIELD